MSLSRPQSLNTSERTSREDGVFLSGASNSTIGQERSGFNPEGVKMSENLARKKLYDYFADQVHRVNDHRNLQLSIDAIRYLSAMLVELSKTENVFPWDEPTTLTELHCQANEANPRQALHLYKQLGDHALYISGFFSESLERKTVGVEYYADMGGSAYYRAAGLTSLAGDLMALSQIFDELSHRFRHCVGVLSEVAEMDRSDSVEDIVRLYERWLTTRDPHTAERLNALGLLPTEPISET